MDLSEMDPKELAEVHRWIRKLLQIDTNIDPDPLIDLPDIATLAGVAEGTPGVWRQRTRSGKARVDFPEPGDPTGARYEDKPLWRAVSEVLPFLKATGNWPPGSAARPITRGPRAAA